MSRDEMSDLQGKRLHKLVELVYHNVPFYREKMQEAGLTPDDIREIGDMAFNTKNSRDQMSLEKVTVLFDDISSGEFPVLKSGSRGVFPKPGGWDTVSYKIYVPSGTGAAYKSHWTDYSSLIVEDPSL